MEWVETEEKTIVMYVQSISSRFRLNCVLSMKFNYTNKRTELCISFQLKYYVYTTSTSHRVTERNFRLNSFVMTNGRIYSPLFAFTGYRPRSADVSVDHTNLDTEVGIH